MWWLSWAAAPYERATRLRAYGYERGWFARRHLPVPVISIGNLTVGGTGKTPLVIQVTEWLLEAGRRVAVLSRGYRRTSREPRLLVSDGARIVATAEEAGDEPFLIAQRCPRAVVAVGVDRYRLGRHVLETCGVDCIVLDDGFQHLGVHRSTLATPRRHAPPAATGSASGCRPPEPDAGWGVNTGTGAPLVAAAPPWLCAGGGNGR